jgi:hypothetical protein
MDLAIKETLLERLRAYLEQLDAADAPEADVSPAADATEVVADLESDAVTDEARDLFSVFVEIAATRNEVRTQSRIVKDALDQFRAVFATLQSGNAALDRELKEAHVRAREQTRAVLRPLLLDLLDVRDRLAAGLAAAPPQRAPPWRSWWRRTATAAEPLRDPGGSGDDVAAIRSGSGGSPRHPDRHYRPPFHARCCPGGGDARRPIRRRGTGDCRIPHRFRVGGRSAARRRGDRGETYERQRSGHQGSFRSER